MGKPGFLGVGFQNGLEVRVLLGSAKKAGFQIGDVVTHCEGVPVDGYRSLAKFIGDTPPGRVISLTITRAGKELTVPVVVGESMDFRVME